VKSLRKGEKEEKSKEGMNKKREALIRKKPLNFGAWRRGDKVQRKPKKSATKTGSSQEGRAPGRKVSATPACHGKEKSCVEECWEEKGKKNGSGQDVGQGNRPFEAARS